MPAVCTWRMNMRTAVAGALLSGSVGLTVFGAGVAHADGPHRWCPGDPKNMPYVVNQYIDWDGDNPPPEAVEPRQCPPIAFMCP